jgi:plasmid stabilization system protein ParE
VDDGGRLSDAEILRSVDATVLDVLLPALRDDADWARAAAIQLVGLVRYAARRGPDPTADRVEELAVALDGLADNALVATTWNGDRSRDLVMRAVSAALTAAVGRVDPEATEVRTVLRPLVVRQLDDELAETAPLVAAFRGQLDNSVPGTQLRNSVPGTQLQDGEAEDA